MISALGMIIKITSEVSITFNGHKQSHKEIVSEKNKQKQKTTYNDGSSLSLLEPLDESLILIVIQNGNLSILHNETWIANNCYLTVRYINLYIKTET